MKIKLVAYLALLVFAVAVFFYALSTYLHATVKVPCNATSSTTTTTSTQPAGDSEVVGGGTFDLSFRVEKPPDEVLSGT